MLRVSQTSSVPYKTPPIIGNTSYYLLLSDAMRPPFFSGDWSIFHSDVASYKYKLSPEIGQSDSHDPDVILHKVSIL